MRDAVMSHLYLTRMFSTSPERRAGGGDADGRGQPARQTVWRGVAELSRIKTATFIWSVEFCQSHTGWVRILFEVSNSSRLNTIIYKWSMINSNRNISVMVLRELLHDLTINTDWSSSAVSRFKTQLFCFHQKGTSHNFIWDLNNKKYCIPSLRAK